jgi:hypothetical protein
MIRSIAWTVVLVAPVAAGGHYLPPSRRGKPTRPRRTLGRYGRMITRLLFEPSRAPT